MNVRNLGVLTLCAAIAVGGCASASGGAAPTIAPPLDTRLVENYVQRLPVGSRVKIEKTDGKTLHGTLMQTVSDAIVVQENTRVPEPPAQIPFGDIARLTVDQAGSTGRSVAIGVATGIGSVFGILMLIAALAGD